MSISADGDRPDPLLGQTLKGMYLLQQRIDPGAGGRVYRAVHLALDAPFAIRILRPARPDPEALERLEAEACAVARLRHPNLVAVTDVGATGDGALFVVMEYV